MALLAMAISALGARGAVVHRLAGRRRSPTSSARQGADHRRHPGPAARRRWTRARSPSSPASRASARTPRTSPRSAAAARTPPPSRSPPRCEADVCEIYTDVDGVFTADPRIVPNAAKLDTHHLRGDARAGRVRREGADAALRRVRPPRTASRCTSRQLVLTATGTIVDGTMEDLTVEQALITGVAHDRGEGEGHRRRRARPARRGGEDLPRRSPTPRSTST